jgi:hypothetical protein
LYPGKVTVFISGYRQPNTAYKILDPYTIMVNNVIVGSIDNYPIEMTTDANGDMISITHSVADEILIEVRQDFSTNELELKAAIAGKYTWMASEGIPASLLATKDFIMIYINGAAYGSEYIISKETESITLTNEDVTQNIMPGDSIIFEWR